MTIIWDNDLITSEPAFEMNHLITNSEFAIIPGGHGEYTGEIPALKSAFKESDYDVYALYKGDNKFKVTHQI